MEDRNDVLRWLISQSAKELSSAMAESDDITIGRELVWDLAVSCATNWYEPEIPEVHSLPPLRQVNLMRLAVELAPDTNLSDSVWLELAAFSLYNKISHRVAEENLPKLMDSLGRCCPGTSSFSSIVEILNGIDAMIETVDQISREGAALVALSGVLFLSRYSGDHSTIRVAPGSAASRRTIVADWVIDRANNVISSQTVSQYFRSVARHCAYYSVYLEAHGELNNGRVGALSAWWWFEQRSSAIERLPSLGAEQESQDLDEFDFSGYDLALICADWLLDNDLPLAALDHLAWAAQYYMGGLEETKNPYRTAIVRASANAAMGDTHLAVRELDLPWSSWSLSDDRVIGLWALGRIQCEVGDVRGLHTLRNATSLAADFYYLNGWLRMLLLLAEKEIDLGHPRDALSMEQNIPHLDERGFAFHTRVVLAEAHIALAKTELDDREEHLDKANEFLKELKSLDFVDSADRLEIRMYSAVGELEMMRKDYEAARRHFRKALDTLFEHPDHRRQGATPDHAPSRYWRRSWSRNWSRVAAMSLIAELISDKPVIGTSFITLQRYRALTHSDAISELAGFTPEMSLNTEHRVELEKLREVRGRLSSQIKALATEAEGQDEVFDTVTATASIWPETWTHKSATDQELKEKDLFLELIDRRIVEVEESAYETRGHICSAAGISIPSMDKIVDHLAKIDAAVIEIVRLDGKHFGVPTKWMAFVVTPEGIEALVDLPADDLDNLLRLLRGDRSQLDRSLLEVLSDCIIYPLLKFVRRYENLFIALDGDAWMVPVRSLNRPRWRFVPSRFTYKHLYANWPVPDKFKKWLDLLTSRMDGKVVSNIISTTHLVRLLERSSLKQKEGGVAVGSSGGCIQRALCQGLARSLSVHPPAPSSDLTWQTHLGTLSSDLSDSGDRPPWMEGDSAIFLGSWHTLFTGDPTSVARFHLDDGVLTLAEFLSRSRHESNIAIILSCNISRPIDEEKGGFSRIVSAGFGMMEALQSTAIVATTHEVTPEVAFVLGRLLAGELANGRDVHTSLAFAQERLREANVADVFQMLYELEEGVPECEELLKKMLSQDPQIKAFPNKYETEPFYILGLPTAKWC